MNLLQSYRALRDRTTALPAESYERLLVCTSCRQPIAVFEAAWGAASEGEHRFLNPTEYRCVTCSVEDAPPQTPLMGPTPPSG